MKILRICSLWLTIFLCFWGSVKAYFLIPIQEHGQGYALKGQRVNWILLKGEPFQGFLLDLKAPQAFVKWPQGKEDPVALSRIEVKDYKTGKKRFSFKLSYIPSQQGDAYLCLISQKSLLSELNEVWQEFSKIPLHVELEKAWDKPTNLSIEIVPLTRPYGLVTNQVFRGKVLYQRKPAAHVLIQVAPYHGFYIPLKDLPKNPWGKRDPSLMYLSLKSDSQGQFSLSFPYAGWWMISARVSAGYTTIGQQRFPLILRGTFWIYVRKPSLGTPNKPFSLIKVSP